MARNTFFPQEIVIKNNNEQEWTMQQELEVKNTRLLTLEEKHIKIDKLYKQHQPKVQNYQEKLKDPKSTPQQKITATSWLNKNLDAFYKIDSELSQTLSKINTLKEEIKSLELEINNEPSPNMMPNQ